MLYISLVNLGFMFVGAVLGVILMALCSISGQASQCEDCRRFHDGEE